MFTCARSSRIYSDPPGASKKNHSRRHTRSSGFPAPEHTAAWPFNKQELGGDLLLHLPVIVIRDLLSIIYSAVSRRGAAVPPEPAPRTSGSATELPRREVAGVAASPLHLQPFVPTPLQSYCHNLIWNKDARYKRERRAARQMLHRNNEPNNESGAKTLHPNRGVLVIPTIPPAWYNGITYNLS